MILSTAIGNSHIYIKFREWSLIIIKAIWLIINLINNTSRLNKKFKKFSTRLKIKS